MLNVNREVTDSFYRYKMPRLVAKVEGKGNGIKTVIVNVVEIAKALNRPPMYPTKYFGIELGAQVNHEVKTDRYIVNGAHDASKLQELLDGFIKRFVLCSACSNPETDLTVRKTGRITSKCKACGNSGEIDATHKLCTFIQREPPVKPSKSKSGEKEKAAAKEDSTKANSKSDEKDKIIPEPAIKNGGGDGSDDDGDWAGDEASLQAAQRARLAELGRAVRALALDEDAEKSEKERADKLHAFLSGMVAQRTAALDKTATKAAGAFFNSEDETAIVAEVERLELGEKALLVFIEVLFSAADTPAQTNGCPPPARANIVTLAKRYVSLLSRLTKGKLKAQSYLLGAFEMLLSQPAHTNEQNLLPNVLMILYEADALDEEAILEWHAHPRKFTSREQAAQVRRSAGPFIEWLEKAEEEDSDEEDDDDEDGSGGQLSPMTNNANSMSAKSTAAVTAEPEEPEEDINIDEI